MSAATPRRPWLVPIAVVILGLCGWRPANAQSAVTLPAMRFVTAPLVAPSVAASYYAPSTTHTNSLAGITGFGATAPEIVETARALKNNPDLIFEYVHNLVQTEFAFGERKGALGTLIDKSGTPFDQNVLFVSLVRQAGYTAQYQVGPACPTSARRARCSPRAASLPRSRRRRRRTVRPAAPSRA
jgi:hypothetical protein